MPTPSSPRSTRDRPAKPPLSADAVVDAGLAILQAEGFAAVTMRRVASALDTGTASLYAYVGGREALLAAMLDRVTAQIPLEPPDPARWRDQLHTLLERSRLALAAHPGIAAVALADPPSSESALALQENLYGVLLAGTMSPQDAAYAADIFAALVVHAAIEHDTRRVDPAELAEALQARFAALPPDRFPLLSSHAAHLVAGSADERFRFAVDVVVDGILVRKALRS